MPTAAAEDFVKVSRQGEHRQSLYCFGIGTREAVF